MDTKIVVEKIRRANQDLESRMSDTVLDFQYDYDADILYLNFGEPQEAFSFEIADVEGVYLRVGIDDDKVYGVDILHFRQTFLMHHPEWQESFQLFFDEFGDCDFRVNVEIRPSGDGPPKIGKVGVYVPKTVRELVPA